MTDINTKIFPSRSGSESPTKQSRTGANGPVDNGGAYSTKRKWSTASLSNEEADEDTLTQQHKWQKHIHTYDFLSLRSIDVQGPVSPPNSRSPSPTKADNDFVDPPPSCSDSANNTESIRISILSTSNLGLVITIFNLLADTFSVPDLTHCDNAAEVVNFPVA